ncbi:MAG: thiamine pyrophosphate-dependent enzyme [Candidatus Odinarchaeota archaeon]
MTVATETRVKSNRVLREKYTRHMPTTYCPGCGHGIVLNALVRALDVLQLDPKTILAVSGIGCSGWLSSPFLKVDSLHVTHGRAIPVATGAKVHNPELSVFIFTGDGDGAGIGGNHLIHAARRNIDLTVILLNNSIYGMTGGQVSPMTPRGARTTTTEGGNPEPAFDLVKLITGAGATYVARWTVYHTKQLVKSIIEGVQNRGFSFIEVLSQCPAQVGRRTGDLKAVDMLMELKNKTTLNLEKEPGKIPLGIFVNKQEKEFIESIQEMKERYLQQLIE